VKEPWTPSDQPPVRKGRPHGHVPGSRTYKRHGGTAAIARIKLRGLDEVDKRTTAARAILAFKQDLSNALGGDLSPQKNIMVDLAARAHALVDHLDSWIFRQRKLITKDKKLLDVVVQRTRIADHLVRTLKDLGLDRVPRDVATLDSYVQEKYGNGAKEPT
jgi:hypothetical protein